MSARAIIVGLAYILCVLVGITFVRAAKSQDLEPIPPERIQPVADRVSKILAEHGMPIDSPPPPSYFGRLNGVDGITEGGAVVINSMRPAECAEVFLAHELTHYFLGKSFGKTPDESEPVARAMEHLVTTEFLPGCYSGYKRVPLSEALIAMRQK